MSKFILKEIRKMIKRIISIALVAFMLMTVAAIAVSAADGSESAGADASNSAGADTSSEATGSGNVVKFDPAGWNNVGQIFCHIWEAGKDSFFGWQSGSEKCTKNGAVWEYDLDKLNDSDYVKGGLQSDKDYCIIFSSDTGMETYGCTFGPDCAGDTLYMTGEKIENTEDSTKSSDEAVFENHTNYGPHLACTSIGNVVGKNHGIQVIGDWLPKYYISTYIDDVTAVLKKALPQFGITTADDVSAVYGYILAKDTGEDEAEMKKILEEASGFKIDEEKAKDAEKKIQDGGTAEDLGGGSSGGGNSGSGDSGSGDGSGSGSGDGGSTYGGNGSGSGADGQETTIFAVLAIVMIAAAGVMFVTRRRED